MRPLHTANVQAKACVMPWERGQATSSQARIFLVIGLDVAPQMARCLRLSYWCGNRHLRFPSLQVLGRTPLQLLAASGAFAMGVLWAALAWQRQRQMQHQDCEVLERALQQELPHALRLGRLYLHLLFQQSVAERFQQVAVNWQPVLHHAASAFSFVVVHDEQL